jgi:predicted Rossmann-fold nucleotide-binding protein
MMKKSKVAFIGTRQLERIPQDALDAYVLAASRCADRGYILATGAAKGADQLAAEACLENGGHVNLYLPWPDYEQGWVWDMQQRYPEMVNAFCHFSTEALDSVKLHPYPAKLKEGGIKLMARNYMIVDGCQAVVAIPTPPCKGGTAQGIRIAEHLGIRVHNLSIEDGLAGFRKLIT